MTLNSSIWKRPWVCSNAKIMKAFVADLISRKDNNSYDKWLSEPTILRLEESTVKATSLILIGRTLMKTELNFTLKFQHVMPLEWTDSIQKKCTILRRRIWSLENVEKLTTTAFPFYQNILSNSCRLKSCLRQQVTLLQSRVLSTNIVNALLCLLY